MFKVNKKVSNTNIICLFKVTIETLEQIVKNVKS